MENDKVVARVVVTGPWYRTEDKSIHDIHWLGTVVTSAGQLWDVRWNGISVTPGDIEFLWRHNFDFFTQRIQSA